MNKVIMQGHLTKDVEVTFRNDLAIARGSIALDRGQDKDGNSRGADFPSFVAFGKRATFLEKYGKKGRRFLIEGHIQTGKYDKQVGSESTVIYTTDVVVDRIEFSDSKPADQSAPAVDDDGFMHIPDGIDEELPFN